MDYRDEVFMAVAEKLSFSKAAEELFISQPAVTKHVKELENKMNTALVITSYSIHYTKLYELQFAGRRSVVGLEYE